MIAVRAAFTLVAVASGPANLAVSIVAMSHGIGPALRMAAGLVLGLALCALNGLCNYLSWALLLSRGPARRGYARAASRVDGIIAALFATAGLGLIRQGLMR